MTNEELVIRIKAGIDTADNMAALWQKNKGFIYKMANRFQGQAEEDDLVQEGFIGLCHAVDGYNPDSGANFLTYAGYWIRQAMQRYIENNGIVRIPVHRQVDIRKYQKVVSNFQKHYGRKPEIRELMDNIFMSYKDIIQLEKDVLCLRISSIETPIVGDDEATLGELLTGCDGIEDDIIESVDHAAMKELLWSMVDELPGQQGPVLHARYESNLTRQEISERLGCTEGEARDEEYRGLRELRKSSRAKKIRPYYNDYLLGSCYHIGVAAFNRTWTSEVELAVIEKIIK